MGIVIYLLLLADALVFPLFFDALFLEQMRATRPIGDGFHLVPLDWAFTGAGDVTTKAVLLANLLLLGLLLGLLLPLLGLLSLRITALAVVVLAVGAEGVQVGVNVLYGFDYRRIVTDEGAALALGALLGSMLFRIVQRAYRAVGLTAEEVGEYLHHVFTGGASKSVTAPDANAPSVAG